MISNLRSSENAPAYSLAANEGVIKAIVNFYRDESDSVFLRLSHDLRPNKNRFVWTRVTRDLRNGGPLEMLSIAKPIKIKVLLHQFSLLMLNLRYIVLLKCFTRPTHSRHSENAAL